MIIKRDSFTFYVKTLNSFLLGAATSALVSTFQSDEKGALAAVATARERLGRFLKVKVVFVCHNIKEVSHYSAVHSLMGTGIKSVDYRVSPPFGHVPELRSSRGGTCMLS